MLRSVLRVMLCRYTCFTKCSRVIYCAVHCLGNCIAFPCFVALRCLALRCNKYVTLRYLMSFEVTLPCDTVRYLMSFEVTLPCDTVRYLMSFEVMLPCDTVRYLMSSEVMLPCDTVRYLMSSEVMLPCDTCYGSICRGVIWYTTIPSGMVCFCKQRHGMLWYNWGLYGTL